MLYLPSTKLYVLFHAIDQPWMYQTFLKIAIIQIQYQTCLSRNKNHFQTFQLSKQAQFEIVQNKDILYNEY